MADGPVVAADFNRATSHSPHGRDGREGFIRAQRHHGGDYRHAPRLDSAHQGGPQIRISLLADCEKSIASYRYNNSIVGVYTAFHRRSEQKNQATAPLKLMQIGAHHEQESYRRPVGRRP